MVWGATAAVVGGQVVGGIMARSANKKSLAAQAAAAAEAYAELEKLGTPPDLSSRIIMQEFTNQGLLTPELEQEIGQQASGLASLKEDEFLRGTQVGGLNKLIERYGGGFTAEERASYNKQRMLNAKDTQAQQSSILSNAAATGQSGSGNELFALMAAGQSGADRMSEESDRLQSNASQAALQAISQGANMAQGMRQSDMTAMQARLEDENQLNRFNTQNRRDVQRTNVGARNAAQESNLQNAQRIADANVTRENLERQRMNEAKGQFWDRKSDLAIAKANARSGQVSNSGGSHAADAQMFAGLGGALATGITSYAQQRNSDLDRENNLEIAKSKNRV